MKLYMPWIWSAYLFQSVQKPLQCELSACDSVTFLIRCARILHQQTLMISSWSRYPPVLLRAPCHTSFCYINTHCIQKANNFLQGCKKPLRKWTEMEGESLLKVHYTTQCGFLNEFSPAVHNAYITIVIPAIKPISLPLTITNESSNNNQTICAAH